ncbi:MAG: hypothetical protein JRJ06_07315, partial [Deltaproteobacteria bacterium]|nr:hypothetical protein [Deltaproteobacteria bacterium]
YYRFHYADEAGKEINPPYPLNQLTFGPCEESYIYPGDLRWVLKDKDDKFFSRNGGLNGEPATDIVLRYFYRLQAGFWYDLDADGYPDEPVGTPVPLLEGLDGTFDGQTPVDVTYAIRWPDTVPTLFVGEILADAKTQDGETVGLPNIKDQCIVKVLFDQPVEEASGAPNYALHSVNLIDPLKEYSSSDYHLADPENDLPQSLKPEKDLSTNRWMFRTLPYHLQTRLSYDEVEEVLKFKGIYSNITGEPLLLLNVLSDREIYEIEQVFVDDLSSPDPTFMSHVNELQSTGENNLQYPPSGYPEQHFTEMKALTAGDARGTGYVTLAFNNHEDCPAPTMLSVIKVSPDLYRGDIKVFESPNPFAEKVTMRHNGDFGGNADIRYFEWKYRTADFSGIPLGPDNDPPTVWKDYKPQPYDGDPTLIGGANFYISAVDTVIQGTGQQLLPDKWFSVRYHYQAPWGNFTSVWTDPQLYEGWIKRVMKKINLFDQKVKDFHASDVNTIASMIAQAGGRYEGDVALSDEPEYLQGLGIIEVYETLLNRGRSLIGEGDDFADINKALLFASSRLADLYMLEGLEAAADACDPTIGFSTEDGQVGSEASSIFCFQNQVDSLLEEELVLLRGRADEGVRPVYNRLTWNFTLDYGELAYKENYNITDQATDQDGDGFPDAMDGEINELDAMVMFPQGHGDAWGHYLMAAKKYYSLLNADNFTWIPEPEAILVAGTPIDVDYRDERKFASVAAAKARTGSEIVNLTYRQHYVEDPEGQWQGYKDLDPVRAWGVDGWARRAGQGALFDWVVGNAILPDHYEGGPPVGERQIAGSGQTEFTLDDI